MVVEEVVVQHWLQWLGAFDGGGGNHWWQQRMMTRQGGGKAAGVNWRMQTQLIKLRRPVIRVHPCAHPQHINVLKHFLYIQYGCGMQSVVVYSLNHDTTAHLGSALPQFSKILPPSAHV